MKPWQIYESDVLAWAEGYTGPRFQAVFCDPPYGLSETPDMAEVLKHWLAGDDYSQGAQGFMGRTWDSFVPGPATWAAIRSVCLPGAILAAFGGTRTADLLSVAIRLAGWEKFDEIDSISWVYGSGFPKIHDISKAIDRDAGAERKVVGYYVAMGYSDYSPTGDGRNMWGAGPVSRKEKPVTIPATDLAKTWQGYTTALKPAHEPILLFRNPRATTYAQTAAEHGTGALNIDAGRIAASENLARPFGYGGIGHRQLNAIPRGTVNESHDLGRYPANFVLAHHPDCNGECAPECSVAALAEQSGELISGTGAIRKNAPGLFGLGGDGKANVEYGDIGTAARFFNQFTWGFEEAEARLSGAVPFFYQAKASAGEREAGLHDNQSLTTSDGRARSIDNPYQRGETERKNPHPTVKPLALNKHIASLLLPPAEYAPRRILVPFSGVGSEMIGCLLAGWEEVVGVELNAEQEFDCVQIAEKRLAFWQKHSRLEISEAIQRSKPKPVIQEQLSFTIDEEES